MTVLVACNASAHGQAALTVAIQEAERRKVPLAVLVLNPGDELPPELAAPLADLRPGDAAPTVTFRREGREVSDTILDAAEACNASLIVLGARKRSGQGTFVMGTTTQRVLLDAHAPVLVVKDAYDRPEVPAEG